MARRHKLLNVKNLADHTSGLVEVAFHTTRLNRANMEQLPFPDENFHEDIEEQFQRNNKFTLEHIHHHNGRAFVPKVPVHIISITVENSHGNFRQLLDPYLYCVTIEHGSVQWSIYKSDENFQDLHNELMQFANTEREKSINALQPWLAIKDTYVVYMQPDTYEIRFPILLDCKFEVAHSRHHIDNYYRIKIKNLQCKIVVKCRTSHECEEWMHNFKMLIEQAYGFIDRHANRFNSYAPIRENQRAHWFINGKSYMKAVARALLTAKEEVFITDWWLSPEIMMIRPTEDETYRLDNLLATAAAKGVRVYVMVFKELKRVLPLSSLYTKKKLLSKNKNGFIKRSDRMKTALNALSQIDEDTVSLDSSSTNETQTYRKSRTPKCK
ncbi:unnamed protein product [Rotaria sp. Silwood2]|nr:unnamed protein product [Rotaria sp. Silwood2]CAF4232863.1 unnamed protein product [Rotaria sp. Silwood2]